MNLEKLFSAQKKLRERINYNGEDRFEKTILALLVEIAEVCQEWRGFKYWSKDQEPKKGTSTSTNRTEEIEYYFCGNCNNSYSLDEVASFKEEDICPECEHYLFGMKYTNPLLEEFVDGLHFDLDLCIDLGVKPETLHEFIGNQKKQIGSVVEHFGYLYNRVSELMDTGSKQDKAYKMLHITNAYIGLGYRLGFTWEQIEQAYFDKNQINHQRQESGY